ncbi:MAG: sensor histidine kinase/response rgulator [Myxococcales bacterium]|nr:sensor histidine kinase/response rgulator [Myxococcales bacterium]
MPSSDGLRQPIDVLRNAARGGQERFLVGLADAAERRRLVAALSTEGFVQEVASISEALARLADESFDVAVLDVPEQRVGRDPLAASRELRPFTDVVLITESDPVGCGDAFGREVAAVLPRPLPEVEALLRAYVKRLAGFRRSRTRGQLVLNAFAGVRDELTKIDASLAAELGELSALTRLAPSIIVLGDDELARSAGAEGVTGAGATSPDAVVVSFGERETLDARMQEARGSAAGAAVIVVDSAPSIERLRDSLYGGARAYLPRAALGLLGRIAASAAQRRQGEALGVRIVEVLARHGILSGHERTRTPAPHRDIDVSLIADQAVSRAHVPVVPTGHEVLVVDDEAVVLTVLREALRRGGYRVTTAASAEEAIDLMHKRRFDLVLTDKNLPGASGLDVLRAARGLTPAPAIVLITGYTSYDSAVEALDIGAHDYIEKPIRDVEDLRFRIRRALSRRDEQLARPRPARSGEKGGEKLGRVLVVEVEGQRRQLIADFLAKRHHVTAAKDGDEALALLKKEQFDLVLADRHLPGTSGLRVIEHAQRLLPHCASVLYTAYPSYDSVKEAFATGVDAYLVRPSEDLKKLAEKVAEAIGGRGGILLG